MRIAFATIVLLAVAVISGPGAWGAYVDITNTGDPVDGFNADGPGADWPGGESPSNTIDNNNHSKYLNFGTTGDGSGSGTGGPTGITVMPSGSAFVGTSASWGTAPVVGLRLRTAGDAPKRDPADYLLEGSDDGGLNWTPIASGATGLDGFQGRNTWMAPITFANAAAYADYRLGFNIVGPENSMQIGEVEFLAKDTDVFNGSFLLTEGAVGVAVPDNGNWPSDGLPSSAMDNDPNTKYLHFDTLNTGLDITPVEGDTVVKWIGLTSGNDHPERDPIDYELYGSNDNGESFALIASGSVPAFDDVRYDDAYIDISDNTSAYDQYRILFPHVLDNNPDPNRPADSMQIAEIALYGVPEPSTLALLAVGLIGLGGTRFRRRAG